MQQSIDNEALSNTPRKLSKTLPFKNVKKIFKKIFWKVHITFENLISTITAHSGNGTPILLCSTI